MVPKRYQVRPKSVPEGVKMRSEGLRTRKSKHCRNHRKTYEKPRFFRVWGSLGRHFERLGGSWSGSGTLLEALGASKGGG